MPLLPSFLGFLACSTLLASATPRYSDLRQRAGAATTPDAVNQTITNQTTCNNEQYTYQQLAGYGFVPSNAVDKYGDTLGGYGSAIAIDRSSWKKSANGSYTGLLWAVPDRGWYVGVEPFMEARLLTEESGTRKELSTTRTVSTSSPSP